MARVKTILAWLISLLLLTPFLYPPVRGEQAKEYKSGDYQYTVSDNGKVMITKYTGGSSDLTVPDTMDGYRVEAIGEGAFILCNSLVTLTLPRGLMTIGKDAFLQCDNLVSVLLQDGITIIGEASFYACDNLKNITLPDSLSCIDHRAFSLCKRLFLSKLPGNLISIGDGAFANCDSFISLALPDGLISIGGSAFEGCDKLSSISMPDSLINVGEGVFANCDGLINVNLPRNLADIERGMFWSCSNLKTLTLPDSLTRIGGVAFFDCENLKSLVLPKGLTSIEDSTFNGCSSLMTLNLPSTLISIGESSFSYCNNLISLTLPEGLSSIGDYAFSGCERLTALNLPGSVTMIGKDAFVRSPNLTITVEPDSYAAAWAKKSGVQYQYKDSLDWLTTDNSTSDSGASGEDDMARYTGFYTGLENTTRYVTFPYDDALPFEGLIEGYSPKLAYASMALSATACSSENAIALMTEMGFVRCTPWDYRPSSEKDNDFTGACMGYKQVVRNGKAWDLFLITIQGTHGTYDWLSNFHFGDGKGVHAGFSQAKDTLMGHFRDYLKSLQTEGFVLPGGGAARMDGDRGNNLIWITGHSRGGAVGNLLAAELEGSTYVNGGNLHCYTFASPCVTSKPEAGNRQGFFNFINPGDFVTTVPLAQWGFARYGKTIRLSDDPSWKTEMQDGFTRRTGWEYQGTTETENTELIGEVLELAPTVDDYYHKNYGLTLSRNILSRLTKALGVPFTPQITCVANLFEGVAFAMAEDWLPAAGWGAVQAVQDNAYINLLLRLFNSSKIEQGIPHAHSLESYLSWMAALASDAKAPSNPGLPAYISRLKVTGGTLSPTYEPGITEYTVSVPAGSGKVSVSAEPAAWYDLDAQASSKGKVVLEFKSNKLSIRESSKTKIDLTIPDEGADLSLNVLTWETAEQTKYVLHFVREKVTEVEELGKSAVATGDTVTFGRYEQDNDLQNGKEPIQWRVLDVDDGRALIISEKNLDSVDSIDNVSFKTWEHWNVRQWLNSEFMQTAFTTEEQKTILKMDLENNDNDEHGTDGGNDTKDRVFLLSIEETIKYFNSAEDLRAQNTKYAKAKGAQEYDSYGRWWLRSPGWDEFFPAIIESDGSIGVIDGIYEGGFTIRPTIWIDLALAFESGAVAFHDDTEMSIQSTSISIAVGDLIKFGSYEQDNNLQNGKEPITWLVLALEGNNALLISEKNLDNMPYEISWTSCTWETCSLRAWLNREFQSDAFTLEEQRAITQTKLKNKRNQSWGTYGGADTTDGVFLLSIAEAELYFEDDTVRKGQNTDYTNALIWRKHNYEGDNSWWLRSPGATSTYAAFVDHVGFVNIEGNGVGLGSTAAFSGFRVRPAIWLDLRMAKGLVVRFGSQLPTQPAPGANIPILIGGSFVASGNTYKTRQGERLFSSRYPWLNGK